MAEPSSSLAAQLRGLLLALRDIAGPGAKVTLCFGRGGWSPDLFAEIIHAGFDLLTYRKAEAGKDIPALLATAFSTAGWTGDDGRQHQYDLADTTTDLAVIKGTHKWQVLTLRQVTCRDPGRGGSDRQVHILTTRDPDDPERLVPYPAKKTAAATVKTASKALAGAEAARQGKLTALRSPAPGQAVIITNTMLATLGQLFVAILVPPTSTPAGRLRSASGCRPGWRSRP
jgi:hypothetical protein